MRPIPDAPAEGYEPAIAAIEQLVKLVRLYEIIVVPRQEHHATQGLRPVESHAAPAAGFLRGIEIGQRIPVEQFVFVVARIPVAAFGSDYLPDRSGRDNVYTGRLYCPPVARNTAWLPAPRA